MEQPLMNGDKQMNENIDIHIMMNMEEDWKKTLVYRIFRKKNPSQGWKDQYRRIITWKFQKGKLT